MWEGHDQRPMIKARTPLTKVGMANWGRHPARGKARDQQPRLLDLSNLVRNHFNATNVVVGVMALENVQLWGA